MKIIEGISNQASKAIDIKKIYILESKIYKGFFNLHSSILLMLSGFQQIGFLLQQRWSNSTKSPNFYYALITFQGILIIFSFLLQQFTQKLWAKFIYRCIFNISLLEYSFLLKQIDMDNVQISIYFVFFIKSIREIANSFLQVSQLISIIIYLGFRTILFEGNPKNLFILIVSTIMAFFLSIEPFIKVKAQEQQRQKLSSPESKNQNDKKEIGLFSFQDSYSKQMMILHKVPSRINSGSTMSFNKFNNSNLNYNQSQFAQEKIIKMCQSNQSNTAGQDVNETRFNEDSQINLLKKQPNLQINKKKNFENIILDIIQTGIVFINSQKELIYSNKCVNRFFGESDSNNAFDQLMIMNIKQRKLRENRNQQMLQNNRLSSIAKDEKSRFDSSFSEILNNNTNINTNSKKQLYSFSEQENLKLSSEQKQLMKSLFSLSKKRKSSRESFKQLTQDNLFYFEKNKKLASSHSDLSHNELKSHLKLDSKSKLQKECTRQRSLSSINVSNTKIQTNKQNLLQNQMIKNINHEIKMKQQIIPLSVLDIFNREEVSVADIIQKIITTKNKEKKNMFYSAIQLQPHTKEEQFKDFLQKNKSENENRSVKTKQYYSNRGSIEQSDHNRISYYIERNNLIINFNHKLKNQQLQLKIGIYQNTIDDEKQSVEYDQMEDDLYIFIEIIDQSQLQINMQERDIQEYKNRMLSSVSHELRTPLNCSIQLLEMILIKFSEDQKSRMQFKEEQSLFIDEIKETLVKPALLSNQLLLNIINDILDYSQINQGQLKLVFQRFSIFELLTECAEMVYFQAALKGLSIELHFDPNLPELIHSDRNRIRQVILNLLSNSLKFTNSGYIEINVQNESEELIRVDVCDSGCGIPQENLKKIFECFGNKSRSSILNTQGAGLGLSIANSLAMGIGGNRRIQVESIQNEGTVFSFFIVNRSLNKKGCQVSLKDIFNKRVMKWESITHWDYNVNSLSSSLQQAQKGLKNIQTNSNKTSSKLNADITGRSNPIENQENSLQSDVVSQKSIQLANNLISFSLKPIANKYLETFYPARGRSTSMNQAISPQKKQGGENKIPSLIEHIPSSSSFGDENQYNIPKFQKIDLKNINIRYGITQNIPNNTTELSDSCLIEDNPKDVHSPPNDSFIKTAMKNSQNYINQTNIQEFPNPVSLSGASSEAQNSIDFCIQIDERKGLIKNRANSSSQESTVDKQVQSSLLTQKYIENPQLLLSEQRKECTMKMLQTINSKQKCKCPTILIVDDNDFNIYTLYLRLRTYGFQVDKATSGDLAIQKVKHKYKQSDCCKKYRMIFMDIDMPIKDGHQTTIEINQFFRSKSTKPTPISACTAYVQEKEIQKAYESGMKFYITKPINQRELEEILLTIFQKSP